MTQTDEFGEDLADFVRRVGELRSARALPPGEQRGVLDAALFELQHAAESLWPRYERLAARAPDGTPADRQERQLLKTLFQRLPLPVALVDRDTVVRRMNAAATGLTGMRAGYATGRPLAGLLVSGDRGPLRTQAAATARGEGARSLTVRLQQRPDEPVRASLVALPLPGEPQPTVLVVLQPGVSGPAAPAAGGVAGRRLPPPDLAEATQRAGMLDLVDAMACALLACPPGDAEAVLRAASRVLHGRFADWVVADTAGARSLRRAVVLGPADAVRAPLVEEVARQDPAGCPLVVEAARGGSASLQVRPEDVLAFGEDASGAPVLVRAEVSSLLCLPLPLEGGGVAGVLTLLRTGAGRAFSMAEGQAADVMSRHIALAMRRRPA
ncbi:PAS domain protein [Streptomyces sp. WAC05374]|uniref:PAS domain-containing protein n=1 Tax=Streptomyces sp. WAC05374 TaxID=2487420 RepID=UPI000F85F2E8|nr:PAS domain-containing protein [Streptomyces sp. WAC05374]RST15824.1 PAS domain protein [Streptomyces sp. WAC05374]TDF46060.1 PAS domain protein [Streptomyces sp. WAC05374]TDF53051.1 PAS domain protein [Streptomyces sp. WAC05374]TDF58267.1 PAS domain protein [Streptomyces sp. WAC05374]